jgi:NAD(P)-dependent dehydrogenase (short-subunit alcohol dehydrogenase family)
MSSNPELRSVLITGAGRGIGRAAVLRLAEHGWHVYAGVRSGTDGERLVAEAAGRVTPLLLDVTDPSQIADLDAVLPAGLDAVVNNAGIVIDGPIEAVSAERLRSQFDVNVFGAVAVTQAVLPRIRSARGRILFVSSVSGRISTPMTGAYNSSKFALEGLVDALRIELRPWGIKTVLIEPNSTDTDLWGTALETLDATEASLSPDHARLYAGHLAGVRRTTKMIQKLAVPVGGVVDVIELALDAKRPRARYPVGAQSKLQLALTAATPTPIVDAALALATGIPRRVN